MLALRRGESSLVLAPRTGGALLGWTLGPHPLLRRALPDAIVGGRVSGLAGFPLVPFANRIACGRFRWQGREYRLERNFGDHPHAIHGVGWQSAWQVDRAEPARAVLALAHRPDDAQARHWPFAFDAALDVALTADGATVALRMVNRHSAAAPAGLGLHPYFPRSAFTRLQFRAAGVWLNGPDALPQRHVPVPPDWDHGAGRAVGSAVLDNCFTGWDRRARLLGRALDLAIEAEAPLDRLQVYTPEGQDFFCVEPVSHMPDAINRPEQPMRVLAPGEELAVRIRFRVERGPNRASGAPAQ